MITALYSTRPALLASLRLLLAIIWMISAIQQLRRFLRETDAGVTPSATSAAAARKLDCLTLTGYTRSGRTIGT